MQIALLDNGVALIYVMQMLRSAFVRNSYCCPRLGLR